MPRPSSRLDLIVVSADIDRAPDRAAFAAVCARWQSEGRLAGDGPGPGLALVEGGFRRVYLDLPGRTALYANQQGGFYARCPVLGRGVPAEFGRAVEAWRAGGPRSMACPACGQVHPLEGVDFAPPAAFARGAVIFTDAGSLEVEPAALDDLRGALGGEVKVLGRRAGA